MRPRRKVAFDIGQPEGLVSEKGLTGDAFRDARLLNKRIKNAHYCLHARRIVSGREVPRCCWPVASPLEGPDDQVCGITDPDMLGIDHVNDDGREDRKKWKTPLGLNMAILTKERGVSDLQILCANHNQKKNAAFSASHGRSGRPQVVSDEQIRMTLGLTKAEASRQLGVTVTTIARRRRELLDLPVEDMVD